MKRSLIGAALLAVILSGALPVLADGSPRHSALKTAEGVVAALDVVPGEGGIQVLQVVLQGGEPQAFLVAPPEVLQAIGFEVREGDRLKLKHFTGESGPFRVHKVMNLSRGTMIRVRTLRQVPLWDNQGRWSGDPGRSRPGHGGAVRGGRR